jgi:putative ABC transport system substrate-binding protein
MNRRNSLRLLAGLAAAGALPASSQITGRLPRVGVLHFGSRTNFQSRAEALLKGLAELGYVEGKSVAVTWRAANGQLDLLGSYAQELGQGAVDVVVSASTNTSRALRKANAMVPVVMASVEDPVAEGFVKAAEKPATNMTGIAASTYDHLERHVEVLMAVTPRLTRITALVNPDNPSARGFRGRMQSVVRSGTRLIFANAATVDQIESAFPARAREDADGLVVMNDTLFFNERRTITEAAARARRPAIYPLRAFVEAGGLMSLGPNQEANFYRAATFIDRILKGTKPGDVPMEPSPKIELVISRDVMQNLGLQVPPDLAKQAVLLR